MRHNQPNIILILCDDLGYGDISCYGSTRNQTPVIDRMADEGVLMTDFYMTTPVCSPSRAGLMTGCYPQRVGLGRGEDFIVLLPGDSIGLNPDEVTLPKVLKSAGYRTKIIGKWHLGDQEAFLPLNNGFDSYFGLPYSNDMKPGLHEKFNFPPLPLMENNDIIEIDPTQETLTERYTAEAVKYIKENKDNPFFLYFPHMYVHWPWHAPEPFVKNSKNGVYGATVEHIDWSTGQILQTLKDCGIDDNTIVIFTSDNGGINNPAASNLPLRGYKCTVYEGGLRVPCIVRWPNTISGRRTLSQVTTAMDLMPTLARLAGAKLPHGHVIDGNDITPLLTGQTDTPPYDHFFYYYKDILQAIRKDHWKYLPQQKELYNLDADLSEKQNVFEHHTDIVEELDFLCDQGRQDLGDVSMDLVGTGCRQPGKVNNPTTLTQVPKSNPYHDAEYD